MNRALTKRTCTTTKEVETSNGLALSLGQLRGYGMKIQMNNTT